MPNLDFDMPQNQSSVIKVIGVGGGGSNAVNYMFHKGIRGVDFVVCNTDQQALDASAVPNKIQLGVSITEGLGAGADPEKGRVAAEENIDDVKAVLESGTKMVFINAGMGGGTGTGAAPVIAHLAREMNILTVAIVTIPFVFEGKLRMLQAEEGIKELKQHVDSLIVINNNKLREIYGNLGFKSGFAMADEILATASRGIAEVITQKGHLNIDLNDAKTVLSNSGTALMGSGTASGSGRALKAVKGAIESPLLDNNHIRGAKKVLLLIVSGSEEVTFEEMGEISDFIQDQVMVEGSSPADIIMGVAEDEELETSVNVTVVATGFHEGKIVNPLTGAPEKVVHDLTSDKITGSNVMSDVVNNDLEIEEQQENHKQVHILHLDEEEIVDVINENNSTVVKHNKSQNEAVANTTENDELNTDHISEQQVSMTFEFDCNALESEPDTELSKVSEDSIDKDFSFRLDTAESIQEKCKIERNNESDLNSVTDNTSQVDSDNFEHDIELHNSNIGDSSTLTNDEDRIVHVLEHDDDLSISQSDSELDLSNLNESIETIDNPQNFAKSNVDIAHDKLEVDDTSDILYDGLKQSSFTKEQEKEMMNDVDLLDQSLDSSVNKVLSSQSNEIKEQIERAKKRKERLQKFNYRFRNNSIIQKAESEPAYKRQGVQLDDAPHSSEEGVSKIRVELDEDGSIELKSKNSFLHDNVD